MSNSNSNPLLLAADDPSRVLPLLRSNPALASIQDEHGYSMIHAAASYNLPDILRALVIEFKIDVNIRDEDGDTGLFVTESTECARLLVEELGADTSIRNYDGKTARERIQEDDDWPEVAAYLLSLEVGGAGELDTNGATQTQSLPNGIKIDVGTMSLEDIGDNVVDPEFARRIEELAARGDFQGEAGQAELRALIMEALRGQAGEEREVRQRTN
jgi:hypothetical protein